MIEKPVKIILGVIAVLILSLFSTIVWNKACAGDSEQVYYISILVSDPNDSFRKGAEQAAQEYNADIHFVSGYGGGEGQQIEYLQREINNGADAIVVFNETGRSADLSSLGLSRSRCPYIAVRENAADADCYIGADNASIGRRLGELVAERAPGQHCYLLYPAGQPNYINERLSAIKAQLDEDGTEYTVRSCEPDGSDIAEVISGVDDCCLVALDEALLGELCRTAQPGNALFGVGYVSAVRTHLETGRIRALVVFSEYDAGYLSVKSAINALDTGSNKDIELELYTADAETMYTDPISKILFPVE